MSEGLPFEVAREQLASRVESESSFLADLIRSTEEGSSNEPRISSYDLPEDSIFEGDSDA